LNVEQGEKEKKMSYREPYAMGPASAVQLCRVWSDHVDALERHLSAKTWALGAVTVVLIAYPLARIAIPAILHGIVPDVVRTALNLI
jgi:hypothetical protein